MALIISPSVVLIEGTTDDPRLPLIGWRNMVTIDKLTVDSADADNPVTSLANPDTSLTWIAGDIGPARIVFTPGSAADIDYGAIALPNFARAGIAMAIDGKFAADDAGWTNLIPEFIPANDAAPMFRLPRQPYYQLSVALAEGAAPAQAAVLNFGLVTALDPGIEIPFTPLPYGADSEVYVGRSVGGHYLGEIEASRFLQSSITITSMREEWYRANLDPMLKARPRRPFFHAWDPVGHPSDTAYAWCMGTPRPVIDKANRRMSITLPLAGIAQP